MEWNFSCNGIYCNEAINYYRKYYERLYSHFKIYFILVSSFWTQQHFMMNSTLGKKNPVDFQSLNWTSRTVIVVLGCWPNPFCAAGILGVPHRVTTPILLALVTLAKHVDGLQEFR